MTAKEKKIKVVSVSKWADKEAKLRNSLYIITLVVAVVFGSYVAYRIINPSYAATTCTVSADLVNSCHPWLGAYVAGYPVNGVVYGGENAAEVQNEEQRTGATLQVVHDYNVAGKDELNSFEQSFASPSAPYLYLNWKPSNNFGDADGGDSSVNAGIKEMAESIQKYMGNKKMFLTIYHEPENNVSPGGDPNCPNLDYKGSSGTVAQYREMWQNVENIFNSVGVTNVVWVMDYEGYSGWDCMVPDLYPGNNLVDWVTFDIYDDGAKNQTWQSGVGAFYNFLETQSKDSSSPMYGVATKPWGAAEYGSGTDPGGPGTTDPQSVDDYFASIKNALDNNTYPNIHLYQIFDAPGAQISKSPPSGFMDEGYCPGYYLKSSNSYSSSYCPPGTAWTTVVGTDSGMYAQYYHDELPQTAYNALATDCHFTSCSTPPPPTPTVTITAPTAGEVLSGTETVSATASVSSGSISKITLSEVNSSGTSTTLTSCSSVSSCSYSWNTNNVSNGNYTINASASASGGGSATAIPVKVSVANAPTCTPPIISTPSGLASPTGDQTTSSITLTWGASTDCKNLAITYHVFRAESGNWKQVGSPTATSYTDTGLTPGTTYDYEVDATDTAGNTSAMSSTVTQETVVPDCNPPGVPGGLSGTATSDTTISLSWDAVTVPSGDNNCKLLEYIVTRTDPSGNITTFTPTSNSFKDTGLTPNTSYSYTVLAVVTGQIKGDSTNPKTVTTDNAPCTDPGPTAPGSLAFPIVTSTGVTLTWNESTDSCGISGYNVFREQQGSSSFTQVNAKLIPQPGSGSTVSFGDNGLSPATTYNYYVVAVSGESKTAQSNTVPVTTPTNPVNPNNGGNSGTGSNGSNSPLDSNPLLIGTTSVGSGSEAGGSVSQNPTSTSPGLSPLPSNPSKAKLTTKKLSSSPVAAVLYSLAGVALLAGCMVLIVFRRHHRYRPAATTPYDPDIFQPQVIHPESTPTVPPDPAQVIHPDNDPNQTNENNKEN